MMDIDKKSKKGTCLALVLGTCLALVLKTSLLFALTTGQNADYVAGQADMTSGDSGTSAYKLNVPHSAYTDGTKLYVAEAFNNRILIYNSIPTSANASANIVVGQADMISAGAGTTAYGLDYPIFAYPYQSKLYVADAMNNRILIYNSIPTVNGASANVVLGPDVMTASGVGTTAYGLYYPNSSCTDGTKLYVTDEGNNRVLIYNSIPTANLASADVVVGQVDMTTVTGAITAYNLYDPYSSYSDGTKLYVTEYSRNRVLIYNSIPTSNNASADVVVGQANMTSSTGAVTDYGLYHPYSSYSNGTKLYVTEYGNNRVLIYNSIPTSNNASADVVVGQPNMTTGTLDTTAYKFNNPCSAYSDGTKLYVTDQANHRVLIYNSIPAVNGASADVVVGQANMTSVTGGITAYRLNFPNFSYTNGTKLYVTDQGNKRVLIYNTIPTSDNASADVVVGQANMTTGTSGITSYKFYNPRSSYTDGTKLYVADGPSNRVLIYNSIPTANNASANVVLGPDLMTASGSGVTATNCKAPWCAYPVETKLYVADRDNNRVLIYNSIPTANLAPADVVVGQPNMTSYAFDTNAYSLDGPYSTYSDGVKLYVADTDNHRVLIYNSIPAANGASADVVVGQTGMGGASAGTTAYNLNSPNAVYTNEGRLYVSDAVNSRVLIYNSIPAANNASADIVLGQASMANGNDPIFPAADKLYSPSQSYFYGTKLYIADTLHHRVLIYNDTSLTRTLSIEGNITAEGTVTAE